MEKLKIGVIGAGAIARRGHLPTLLGMRDVKIVGIAELDDSTRREVASEFSIKNHYADYRELLNAESLNVVDICTPPQTHLEIIKAAAEKGIHVLVEKPLTLSWPDTCQIEKAVRASGIKFSVVQNYRYFPEIIRVKNRIEQGYLGRIVTMHGLGLIRFPGQWTRSRWLYHPGGTLYDYGPHLIDLLLWLNESRPLKVYAAGGDITGGDMGFINYAENDSEFENKAIATAEISWLTGTLNLTIDIHGTGGHIYLDVRSDTYAEVHGFATPFDDLRAFLKRMLKISRGVFNDRYFKGALLYYEPLFSDFFNAVKQNTAPPVSIDEAVMVSAVLEAAHRSITLKRPVLMDELLGKTE